jgi:ABC-type multidrug transport system fused ATPase/permease subunit
MILTGPIQSVMSQVEGWQRAGASIGRIRELLSVQTRIETPETGRGLPVAHPERALGVTFRNVSFAYPAGTDGAGDPGTEEGEPIDPHQAFALHDLSFTLQPGRVLGLLGRTGSGKTTIGRLLFRLYDPEEGAILIEDGAGGTDIRHIPLSELRGRVGMVTQDVQLFQATVRDNLTFFDHRVSDERIRGVLEELGLWSWVRSLPQGLDTELASVGHGLSAGEAQLLALARIFLQDPGLVILDEASSRLDPATERLIERAMDRLLSTSGRTAIVIAHRLSTVQRADEVMILEEGRICEHGSRAALAGDPTSRFYRLLQTGLEDRPPGDDERSTPPGAETAAPEPSLPVRPAAPETSSGRPAREARPASLPRRAWWYVWRLICYRPWFFALHTVLKVVNWAGVPQALAWTTRAFWNTLSGQTVGGVGLWGLAALRLLIALIGAGLQLASITGRTAFTELFATLLRRNLLTHVLNQPGARALPASPGEAVSRFRGDVRMAASFASRFPATALGSTILALTALVVMLRIHARITLLVFSPLIVVVFISNGAIRRIYRYRRASREATGRVTGYLGEILSAAQAVKVAAAESSVMARFRELNEARGRAALRANLLLEAFSSVLNNVTNLGTGAILVLAGQAMRSGEFTVGDLALFISYLAAVRGFPNMIGTVWALVKQCEVSLERLAGRSAPQAGRARAGLPARRPAAPTPYGQNRCPSPAHAARVWAQLPVPGIWTGRRGHPPAP